MIHYYLKNNLITADPNDMSARVLSNVTHDMESLIRLILRRNSTLTEADVIAVLTLLFEVITDEVSEGNSINLPLFIVKAGLGGVFVDIMDSFDPQRHDAKVNISAGVLFDAKMASAKWEKVSAPKPSPMLYQFFDVISDKADSVATPNGIGMLAGEELKFNPENADEGIFFINDAGASTKVQYISRRTDMNLVFSIPQLEAGTYTLRVTKGYGKNPITLRSGDLDKKLTVS